MKSHAELRNPSPLTKHPLIMTSDVQDRKPFRFLDLSAELRLQIYEYSLVRGKIFFSPDDYARGHEHRYKNKYGYLRPQLQLLRVCKQIHAEAEKVYLSQNLFVLPDHFIYHLPLAHNAIEECTISPEGHIFGPEKHFFSVNAAHHLQNISIAFNPRRPAMDGLLDRRHWDYEKNGHRAWARLTPQERRDYAHYRAVSQHQSDWKETIFWFADFFEPRGRKWTLNYLEIDITNAYCPLGCCRMIDQIPQLLVSTSPTHVVIRGALDEEEQDKILENVVEYCSEEDMVEYDSEEENGPYRRERIKQYCSNKPTSTEQVKSKHSLQFDPDEDIWEKWNKAIKLRKSKRR